MNNEIKRVLAGEYDYHILPLFWQKGESKEVIAEYMQKIHDCDIRSVCLESRPYPNFCKEQWWEDLAFIIEQAKQLDMKLWIFDDSHFPTGYANGLIKESYPEHRKKVLRHRRLDAIGPQDSASFVCRSGNDKLYGVVAYQGEKRIDVTNQIKGDVLYIDIPEGNWKLDFFYISESTDVNPDYINMVDKASCDVLIEAVYEPHYQHFKEEFGKTIVGFFTDEPGFMNEKGNKNDSVIGKEMPLPWSDEVERRLRLRFPDDYLVRLSALWDTSDDVSMVRYAYMDIVTQLYSECFDQNIGNWCRAHGVMHIGHIIEDRDSHARLGVGAGHFFRSMAGQDMAGVDIVINQLVPGLDEGTHFYGRGYWDMEFFNYSLVKLGTSLAHIDPLKKGRTMAEVFGAFGWQEGLKEMKWIADHFLVRGVNEFVPHAFSQASFPDWDCPPHFYAQGNNPQYRYFKILMQYMNKMSTLLSNGKAQPTAAILYHAEAEWTGKFMEIQKPAKELTRNQIDFDFIPADVFRNQEAFQCDTKQGLTINGTSYSCFVLPYCEYIGKEVATFITYAKAIGFPVYCIDRLPSALYEDGEIGDMDHVKVVSLAQLASTLQKANLYDIKTSSPQPKLRYYHYTKADGDYRMFFNEDPKQFIQTKIEGLHGYQIDVMKGSCFAFHEELVLSPYSSCIIVETPMDTSDAPLYSQEQVLSEKWLVSFADAKAYPVFSEEKHIERLVNLHEDLYPNYAGTFRYEQTLCIEADTKAQLQLTQAYEVAEVFVDGISQGTCICPPYVYEFDLLQGEHCLAIEVTNTLEKQVQDFLSMNEMIEPSGLLDAVILKTM